MTKTAVCPKDRSLEDCCAAKCNEDINLRGGPSLSYNVFLRNFMY